MQHFDIANDVPPPPVRALLDAMPNTGGGVHNWLFRAACQLHASYLPPQEIERLLLDRVTGCGRRVPRREVVAAVRNSERCARRSGTPETQVSVSQRGDSLGRTSLSSVETGTETGVRTPVEQELRSSIVRSSGGFGLADLWELSPVRLDREGSLAEWIIDLFFPGNPLLCCGSGPARFDTRRREEWRHQLGELALIVPSPMRAVTGLTQDGRPSRHTLDNTGPRRFLVCEFDQGGCQEHAALLWHLSRMAPLVCAVHSGGKSLHGWFFVEHLGAECVQRFFREAVRVGADPATWTRSQFVRLPDGKRDRHLINTVASARCYDVPLHQKPFKRFLANGVDSDRAKATVLMREGDSGGHDANRHNDPKGKRQSVFYLNPQPLTKNKLYEYTDTNIGRS